VASTGARGGKKKKLGRASRKGESKSKRDGPVGGIKSGTGTKKHTVRAPAAERGTEI